MPGPFAGADRPEGETAGGKPAVALMVDNIEMGLDTLATKNFTMISENDLSDIE